MKSAFTSGLFLELLNVFVFADAAASSSEEERLKVAAPAQVPVAQPSPDPPHGDETELSAPCATRSPASDTRIAGSQPAVLVFVAKLAAAETPAFESAELPKLSSPVAARAPVEKAEPAPERSGVEGPELSHSFAPIELPMLPGRPAVETARAPVADRAPEPAEIMRPEPARPSVVREVSLRIPMPGAEHCPGASVEVRVAERAGEVRVAVRASSPELVQSLRQSLPELSANLERAGYRNEIWAPGGGSATPRIQSAAGPAFEQTESGGQPRRQRREPSRTRPTAARATGAACHPPFSL